MITAEILFIIGLVLFGAGLLICIMQNIASNVHNWRHVEIEEMNKKIDKFNLIIMPLGILLFIIGYWLSK